MGRERRITQTGTNGKRWNRLQQGSSPTSSPNLSGNGALPSSSSNSPKIPAAGLGTRIGPRPVPKSSSSLRHISSKGRTVSFGTPMPENRDPSEPIQSIHDGKSTVERTFEAAQRREREMIERESYLDSDDDHLDHAEELDLEGSSVYTTSGESAKLRRNNLKKEVLGKDVQMSVDSAIKSSNRSRSKSALGLSSSSSESGDYDDYDDEGDATSRDGSNKDVNTPDVRVTADESPPLLGIPNGLQTPGPNFPQDLNTPLGTPPDLSLENTITPQERLEWHTMLQSTLRSEVLKSETKRIISADAPNSQPGRIMYQRWLDIRASLRGRGHQKGAADIEEKRLNEGWPILLRKVVDEVKSCRTASELKQPCDDLMDADEEKDKILQEVENVLSSVESAEEQFPSYRKLVEIMPEWGQESFQRRLDGLYSWCNVTKSLRLQIKILQEWTGSQSLDVLSTHKLQEEGADNQGNDNQTFRAELEEGTFLERLLKENSLQSTFEKRTLRTLSQLIMKAKHAIIHHHAAFSEMALPSFEPELVQLINFPTRLMEGALRVRLDYVGKLQDPSVLIVDSLIDDLRAAIALACRIKLQYSAMMVPQPERGWDLPPCIGTNYDAVLREALQYFFDLLNYKLKGSLFFKETEILEPEWRFLSTAVEVIEGADVLVACSITKIVNKLFIRIVKYFERELSAPSTRKSAKGAVEDERSARLIAPITSQNAPRGPPVAGGLTRGNVKMTLDEKVRWIKQVFDSVRIRSRKLLGFARDIRNRLENASEYDLSTLRSPTDSSNTNTSIPLASRVTASSERMDLTEFLQALINAGYFLVLTGSFEAEGTYLIAEPSLHDKPELVQKLFTKCLHRVRQHDEDSFLATAAGEASQMAKKQGTTTVAASNLDESGKEEEFDQATMGLKNPLGNTKDSTKPETQNADDEEPPRYLLILTPRDAFMWTGKVMMLAMERIDVNLKDRRLRLIADGPERRLEMCKKHLYSVFGADYAAVSLQQEDEDNAEDQRLQRSKRRPSVVKNGTAFPLEIVDESLAHMSTVQAELRRINKGVYILSDSINRAVPKIRRNMRGRRKEEHPEQQQEKQAPQLGSSSEGRIGRSKGGDCDDLIQNCFAMAAEQGFRAMPFIESARLRGQMTLALASLAIDWVAFICDDCEPSDRRTFKFAVAALENAMHITQSDYIFDINEEDFMLMRSKVASCVGLLISHFDILGARSSVAKAKEEEERLERERAERSKAMEMAAGMGDTESRSIAAKLIAGSGGAGAPPMLGRADSGMQATEERWVQKVMEWDEARHTIDAEQRLIGRVLDDTRLEDQGLQFLASSSSRIQIRWQQGRFIGGGTFGTVYLAVNLDSGGLMAVKEIRFQDISSTPGMYKQIKDEMSVMEMLSHPNIVEYYGIEVHRDKVYIFEEYCQGGSLAQLLEHGRIEDEMVMQVYTLQMLDGLVYLHSKGVVHRDIKPDNILLDHMGVIKFVDFGAAKVLAKNSRTIQRSRRPGKGPQAITGMLGPDGKPQAAASLQGTPMYMSPEVIKGESRGRRGAMDVWSLGCVVLEFATGKRPWSQLDNEWAIMFHIGMAQQHPPLPEPGQLSDLGIDFIRNCLVIDPYERPSAAEMREHDWIKNLVEALNAANEEEAAAMAAEMSASAGPSTGTGSNYHGTGSATASLALSGEGVAHSMNSSNSTFSRSSLESPNPLTASIGGKRQPLATPSTAATTNVGPLSSEDSLTNKQSFFNDESAQQAIEENEAEESPVHRSCHPSHSHPGYDALVADLVYRREEEETRRMTSSDM
ncbi:uncharacterized protein FA14DRAFT_148229 [Meira miltonrushii]|uniref:Protein kinase domain-containing protein n=1 Tax=Meira miltonrushii TaxID=1280837 RepID=A0A316VAF5_9BASI|nr:uncharacterized protein FA14DRAFT_148229 [Meira miltonrushii]PWN34058.1 hypothetical protein FA14DRAFT_148229 [Meira miltonrushii]